MKQIRYNVFETNSSSTHSLTMCTKKEFDDFCRGELFINDHSYSEVFKDYPKFLTIEQIREIGLKLKETNIWYEDYDNSMTDAEVIEYFGHENIRTWEDSFNSDYLEYFEEEYTTPGGETVIAFGEYGYDG